MELVIGLLVVISVLVFMLLRTAFNPPSKSNQRRVSRRKHQLLSGFLSTSKPVEEKMVKRQEPHLSQPVEHAEPLKPSDHHASKLNDGSDSADAVLGLTSVDAAQNKPATPARARPVSSVDSPIVTVMLLAPKDRPYGGYELLQALLSNGLRYGDQQIFHCYQSQQPESGVLFSCASVVKPGTFDLPNMGGFSTQGLVLFFDAQAVQNPKQAFEKLLQTIDGMVDDLGGEVCDSQQRPFTKESLLTVYRQLDQYLQNCRTPDLFATSDN